jgi:hypothetical protein
MLQDIDAERVCRVLVRLARQIEEIEKDETTTSVSAATAESATIRLDKHRATVMGKRRRVRSTIHADAG